MPGRWPYTIIRWLHCPLTIRIMSNWECGWFLPSTNWKNLKIWGKKWIISILTYWVWARLDEKEQDVSKLEITHSYIQVETIMKKELKCYWTKHHSKCFLENKATLNGVLLAKLKGHVINQGLCVKLKPVVKKTWRCSFNFLILQSKNENLKKQS